MTGSAALEELISQWRGFVSRRPAVDADSVDELESHLRDSIDTLRAGGLAEDEAFLVAVKRLGAVDEVSREFAREHSDLLWKQLTATAPGRTPHPVPLAVAVVLAVTAGLLVKLPGLLSAAAGDDLVVGGEPLLAVVDGVGLTLAVLGVYFTLRSRPSTPSVLTAAGGFVILIAAMHLYPFAPTGQTVVIAALHVPVALWLLLGVLYTATGWRRDAERMDFIRFTGEWVVYYTLIALGGAVLTGLTAGLFGAIGVDVTWFIGGWMLPCGAAGAVLVAAWLVDAKQSVIENIAPVLTAVFTPLVTLLLAVFAVVGLLQGGVIDLDRDLLILFDATLIVVLGLVLYAQSARAPLAPPRWFDRLQVALLAGAILVDLLVLVAMLARIGTFGVTANKVASLGLNVLLLVNLTVAAVLLVRFLRHRTPFAALERWQTAYVPVYLAWAAIAVIVLPPLFAFS